MAATLDQIAGQILAALTPLTAPLGGPLKLVDHYGGEVSEDGVAAQVLQRAPAVLLALDDERAEQEAEALTGVAETRGRSTWTALVVVADVREVSKALMGTTGATGVYALASRVRDTLSNLIVVAPAATLSVAVAGTPGATVTVGASVLTLGGVSYQPVDGAGNALASFVLSGGGAATILARCATAGTYGDATPGAVLAWSPVPSGAAATGQVAAVATPGASGLLRDERLRYVGLRPVLMKRGQGYVVAVRFAADAAVGDAAAPDASIPWASLYGNEHLHDAGGLVAGAPDPIETFKVP